MAAKLAKKGDLLCLTLSGMSKADFGHALDQVRAIKERRWNPAEKVWEFPCEPQIAERVMFTVKPQPTAEVMAYVRRARAAQAEALAAEHPDDALAPLRLPWADALYPFQRAGVEFMAKHPRAILADDMGLGKTVQSMSAFIEWCLQNGHDWRRHPKLIVAPSSLVGNWANELEAWVGQHLHEPVEIIEGTKAKRAKLTKAAAMARAWMVVNWEQIRCGGTRRKPQPKVNPELFGMDYTCIIASEAHKAKKGQPPSQVANGLWQLQAPFQVAETGTPVLSNPAELWALLSWMQPDVYNNNGSAQHPRQSYWSFFDDYVEYYEADRGRVITGAKNPDALRFVLQPVLIRRTKGQVLGLPEKTHQYIDVPMRPKQAELYADAERVFWLTVARELGEEALDKTIYQLPNGAARCTRLQQILESPALLGGDDESGKLDVCVELIQNAGRPIVVFVKYKATCDLLKDRLAKLNLSCGVINGDVHPDERTVTVAAFQNGELDVIVGTEAMGQGLTLTRADTAIRLTRNWVPALNDQMDDRLHRIGQKNAVTIIDLQAPDTVDTTRVAPANELKSYIVSQLVVRDAVREHDTITDDPTPSAKEIA